MGRPLRSFCRRVQRSSGLVGVASDGARFTVAVPNPRTFETFKDSLVRMLSRIRFRGFVASESALTGPVSDVAEETFIYFKGLPSAQTTAPVAQTTRQCRRAMVTTPNARFATR